jgi:large subunit ribosomal protein L9
LKFNPQEISCIKKYVSLGATVMEVILLERIDKLGQMGDVVNVKPGFARNYLLPKSKALRKNKQNLEHFEAQKAQLETQNITQKAEALKVGDKLKGITVTIIRAAGESGQLYGSVTGRDIADAVVKAGINIGKQQIILDRALKTLGLEPIRVNLHPEVTVEILANIARTTEEAKQQLKMGRPVTETEENKQQANKPATAVEPEPEIALD